MHGVQKALQKRATTSRYRKHEVKERHMTRKFHQIAVAATIFVFAGVSVAEAAGGRVRARGDNGTVVTTAGPNGGAAARARGAVRNDDGSTTAGSSASARGPNGAEARRRSTTTVNPDGSATRSSEASAGGPLGSTSTQATTSRDAEGNVSGQRTTEASGAAGTRQGQVTYDSATGVARTTTCTNSAGVVVACPR
jgi:hypothetical protein